MEPVEGRSGNGMRLNRERLVDAAIDLVDDEGAEALSMRTLAARVDRQVSSLYNHVSGRAELIEHMRARIVAKIDVGRFAQARSSAHERSEEHTSELQSRGQLVCRRLLAKKKHDQ